MTVNEGLAGSSENNFRPADDTGMTLFVDTRALHRTNVEFGTHWPLSTLA
jgi:hypothetical protein